MTNGGKVALFTPAPAAMQGIDREMKALKLKRAMVRVELLCEFLVGEKKLPVDGDFLRGQMPTGDGIPGGEFESWFFLDAD
jgi:hypothetical protein